MKKRSLLVLGITLILAFIWVTYQTKSTQKLQHITGQTMGTIIYNVKYIGEKNNLKTEIDQILKAFNQSLSTYIPTSEISRLNSNGNLQYESRYFFPVLEASKEVFKITDGAYDPSVGSLVKAWGFGPNKEIPELDSTIVDSLRALSGFENVTFNKDSVSLAPNFQLDFSAIAKGYAVDLVAELLQNSGFNNYLVEIGGEVRCNGENEKGETWSLGVENPLVSINEQQILAIVRLRNQALATSGNYRNYYEKDGKTYAHIIDPRTGYNARHNLLSASVFANSCMLADAYATAFMVLGLDNSMKIVKDQKDLDAILVYQTQDGVLKSYVSDGIKPFVELDRTN